MGIEHHYQSPISAPSPTDVVLDQVRLGDYAYVEDGQLASVGTANVNVDDPAGVLSVLQWQRYYAIETDGRSSAVLTGTLAKDSSSLTVTGTGTLYTTELALGDEVVVPGGGGTDYLFVAAITDDTHFDAFSLPAHTASGQTGTRAAQRRLFSGWTGPDVDVDAGDEEPDGGNDAEPGRVFSAGLIDVNTALHFRIMRSAAWSKTGAVGSTTTIGARLAAILATTEVSGLIYDEGLVDYSSTAVEAYNLRNQYLDSILNTMAQVDGRNFTLRYHEATGHLELIWKLPATFYLGSPLALSGAKGDIDTDGLVYAAVGAKKNSAGAGIFSGIQVVGAKLSGYRTRAATADTYEARDTNASDQTLQSSTAINAYGDRQLLDGDSADEKVTCSVILPPDRVHLARRHAAIRVRFPRLPNWDEWRTARILRRDVKHAPAGTGVTPGAYEVALVLGPTGDRPIVTPTFAVIDNMNIPEAEAESTGTFLMSARGTGDFTPSPGGAYPPQPKYGLVGYVYSSGIPIGISVSGSGNVRLRAQVPCELAYNFGSPGGSAMHLEVHVGATVVATGATVTDPHSGLHSWAPTLTLDVSNVAVTSGDQLKLYVVISGPAAAIAAIPIAGTVAPPYQFRVDGALS